MEVDEDLNCPPWQLVTEYHRGEEGEPEGGNKSGTLVPRSGVPTVELGCGWLRNT